MPTLTTTKKRISTITKKIKKKADEESRVVTIKEAKEVAAVKEAAQKLLERINKIDPIIIRGIPIRDRFKAGLKESKASLTKVVKALDSGVKVK